MVPTAEIVCVRVNDEDEVERGLAPLRERSTIVLPLLFSDGFFVRQRLRPQLSGARQRLAEPMVFWPELSALVVQRVREACGESGAVVLVAHGSSKSSASSEAAARFAESLSGGAGEVCAGFLEEPPFAHEVLASASGEYALVGLFFGAGKHGAEDFSALADGASNRPRVAFTVGELPELPDVVARKALTELAMLEGG